MFTPKDVEKDKQELVDNLTYSFLGSIYDSGPKKLLQIPAYIRKFYQLDKGDKIKTEITYGEKTVTQDLLLQTNTNNSMYGYVKVNTMEVLDLPDEGTVQSKVVFRKHLGNKHQGENQ